MWGHGTSIFYGSVLGIFLLAFFVKFVRGNAVFLAGLIGQLIVILIFIPVLERWIFPVVGRWLKQPQGPTSLQKIGAGLVLAILANLASAWVEVARRAAPVIDGLTSICASEDELRPVSELSIWYQVPQYCLIGLGETLAVVAAYDFFYNEAPVNVKSACQGINLLTTALGGTLTTMLQNVLTLLGYLPSDLNQGHQEYLYYAQAVIGILFLILFIFVSRQFQYKNENPRRSLMSKTSLP